MVHKLFKSFLGTSLFYLVTSLTLLFIFSKYLLPDGFIIAGHDSGLALDSKAFLETRLYAWDERVNFGEDNSLLFGSLTLHTGDYLLSLLSGTGYAGNQLNLFFWLSAMFLAAFVFGYQLRSRLGNIFVFIFPVMVVFNFYIFQSLFILERAKYSLVTGSLLFLALLIRLFDGKITLINAAILSALVFTVFNGGSWLGLPLFGGLLIIVLSVFTSFLIDDFKIRNFRKTGRFLLFLFLVGGFFLLLNSYSLFPYLLTFLKKDYQFIQDPLTLAANKAWLDYISQGSSFINLFRLQGIPDWYGDKFTPSQMHPYASLYINNPVMLFLSYLIPIVAFASLLFAKSKVQKRIIGLLAVMSLVSMVFMAATRSPLGFIYEFFYQHIPGFVIFRSSFYKFGYAFIITYSALLSFSFVSIINFFGNKFKSQFFKYIVISSITLLVISGWLSFHYKLLDTSIFNWRTNFSTRLEVPDYVNDYKEYVKNENIENGRVLLLPPSNKDWLSDGYKWGYWSLSTIHYSLTKQAVLANLQGAFLNEGNWIEPLFQSIRNKDTDAIISIASRLGINRFLIREDALAGEDWSGGEDPETYLKILDSLDFVEKEKEFGKWKLYRMKQQTGPLVFPANKFIQLTNRNINSFKSFIDNERIYLVDNGDKEKTGLLDKFTIQRIDQLKCKSCVIEDSVLTYQFVWPRILPNSLLFPLKILNEEYRLSKVNNPEERITSYFGLIAKRTAETEAMLFYKIPDRYVLENLRLIQKYLDEVLKITGETVNPYDDFSLAKTFLDNIHSVETKFTEQLSGDKAGLRSEGVKSEVSKTLWKIYQLKKFYSPILENQDRWENQKVYEINIPQNRNYTLFVNKFSLPVEKREDYILPEATLNDGKEEIELKESPDDKNWLIIPTEKFNVGKNKLVLTFNKQTNLFVIDGSLSVQTPEGLRKCYRGRINAKVTRYAYSLRVKTTGQPLRVFSKTKIDDELKDFLDWNSELRVEGFYEDDYFRSLYTPVTTVDKLNIYICGEHQTLPQFKEFSIEEVFSPEILGIETFEEQTREIPEVSYTRIDPTRYGVKIKSVDSPFVLIMNQKYSPEWTLIDMKDNKEIETKTSPVDMYANGWLIDKQGDMDLIIEFAPQKYFEKGILVSIITLLALGGIWMISFWKGLKKWKS